jgi:hypothetical protein
MIAVTRRMKLEVIQFLHSKDVNVVAILYVEAHLDRQSCSIALENSIEQTLRSK